MTVYSNDGDEVGVRPRRQECACDASPCLLQRPIRAGEVFVYSKNTREWRDKRTRRTERSHFEVKYHVRCFHDGKLADDDDRMRMLHVEFGDLHNLTKHRAAVDRLLAEEVPPPPEGSTSR